MFTLTAWIDVSFKFHCVAKHFTSEAEQCRILILSINFKLVNQTVLVLAWVKSTLDKVCIRAMWPIRPELLPPGWDATPSIKFAGTNLYTWVERGTIKCLHKEHNKMTSASARIRTARSGFDRTNHEASASRCHFWCTVYSTFSTQQGITIFENLSQEFSHLKTAGATAAIY